MAPATSGPVGTSQVVSETRKASHENNQERKGLGRETTQFLQLIPPPNHPLQHFYLGIGTCEEHAWHSGLSQIIWVTALHFLDVLQETSAFRGP